MNKNLEYERLKKCATCVQHSNQHHRKAMFNITGLQGHPETQMLEGRCTIATLHRKVLLRLALKT